MTNESHLHEKVTTFPSPTCQVVEVMGVLRVQANKHVTEDITLYRQSLPQAPAVHTVLTRAEFPGREVEYLRINYFSSDATSEVMKVC